MVPRVQDVTISIPLALIWFTAGALVMLILIIALSLALGRRDAS